MFIRTLVVGSISLPDALIRSAAGLVVSEGSGMQVRSVVIIEAQILFAWHSRWLQCLTSKTLLSTVLPRG